MSALTDAPTRPNPTGLPCSVAVALAELDGESRADLQGWLEGKRKDLKWTDADAHAKLQALGLRVGRQTVGRHRRYVNGYGDQCGCAG